MNAKYALVAIAIATTIGPALRPHPASAEVSGSNTLQIERYQIDGPESRRPVTANEISVPGTLRISFVNRANLPATDVAFLVQDGGRRAIVHDVGTFSPGISIMHQFVNWNFSSSASVTVSSIRYADGSVAMLPAEMDKH
jgi:hypothetical protein